MAVLACVYLLTAVCHVRNQQERRQYYGVFKLRKGQTREAAARRRLRRHQATPVKWLQVGGGHPRDESPRPPSDVGPRPRAGSHLTARTLHDGSDPVRGGPWASPHVGHAGRGEAAAVRRLAARAADGAAARQAVMSYAASLPQNSYLNKHCQNT